MTLDELHDAIADDPTAKQLADAGNDAGCAARMSTVLPPTVVRRMADWSTIVDAFAGPADAYAAITALKTAGQSDPMVGFFLAWLEPDSPTGLDLGNAAVRAMLDSLATGGAITSPQAAAIKALAEVPTAVDHGRVSDAWLRYRPGGIVGGQTQ